VVCGAQTKKLRDANTIYYMYSHTNKTQKNMIIERIYLKNIRSYAEADFCFSPNITLIQGPVGVGKTTLLMAIGFALFGNSIGRGILSRLLKKDAERGNIIIEIEQNNQKYTISRTIKRKKTQIMQEEAYIITNNKKTILSPTEINARITAILNIKNISSSSPIFYVVQDKIKQILYSNEEERMNMVRDIFNIKKYQQCRENKKYIGRDMGQEIALLKKDVEQLNDIKKQAENLEQEKENLEIKLKKQAASITKLKQIFLDINIKYEKMQKNLGGAEKNKQQLLTLQKNLSFLEKDNNNTKNNILSLDKQIKQMNDSKTKIEIKPAENFALLKIKQNEIHYQKDKLNQQIVKYQTQFEEISKQKNKLLEDIRHQGMLVAETNKKISECQIYIKEVEEKYFRIFGEEVDIEKINRISESRKNLQIENNRLTKEREILKGKEQILNTILKNLEKQRTEISGAKSICPICESILQDSRKTDLLKNININIKKSITELKKINDKIKESETEKDKKTELLKDIESINKELFIIKYNEITELNISIEDLKTKAKNIKNENEEISEKQLWLQEQIKQKHQNTILITKEEKNIVEILEKNKNALLLAEKIKILEEQKEKEKQRYNQTIDEIQKITEGCQKIGVVLQPISITLNEDLKKVQTEKQAMQTEIEGAQYLMGKIEQLMTDIKKDIEKIKRDKINLELQKKVKEQKEQIIYWMDNVFIKILNTIETRVTEEILKNFEVLFRKYFKMLLQNSDFLVEIDQKFTPIFSVDDSVFLFEDLSGGEKTAAALSYYLTLAVLLEKYGISALKGILILDEPTTGFGPEQIQNMQKVFSLLPLKQIIIVSHESDFEKSAQHIIKLCKNNNQSYIVC